ncbi:MAG: Quercetin 2,3-dioxygenase [bacterium]|nr:Quercetin 2,3-dioxygenase [bacterium]
MIQVRPAAARGQFDFGWLKTAHTFSFGEYCDPEHIHFRTLRVINDDRVAPRAGFPTHPHRDMEIITYLLSGALEHRDSIGNGSVIRPGDVQRMTAGTGVTHSEFSASDEETHLLQIWIFPEEKGLTPGYEQATFPVEERTGTLRLVASRDGREGSVTVHQDVALYAAILPPGAQVSYPLAEGRHAWLQVGRGTVQLNGTTLTAGDGAAVSGESQLELRGVEEVEILLFDLA